MTTEQMETQTITEAEKMRGHLYHYRRFSSELGELEKKIGQDRADESALLDNLGLDDEATADRLIRSQALQKVHESHLAAKRAQVGNLLKSVENTIPLAAGELGNECSALIDQRRAIITARILRAAGLPDDGFKPRGLIELINLSPLLIAIEQCLPSRNVCSPLSAEQKAEQLLEKFQKLETEKSKVI
jgi:hypothetical protein